MEIWDNKVYVDRGLLLHLIDYVLVVADVVLKGHRRFPWVILGVYAAAGSFAILMTCHSQRISRRKHFTRKHLSVILTGEENIETKCRLCAVSTYLYELVVMSARVVRFYICILKESQM